MAGTVRFSHVAVRHVGRSEALAATVHRRRSAPGELVALTGPSGCGKSTALAVLLGFAAPAVGSVTVGGQDLSAVDPDVWRRRVAWMPQRPWLSAGTIADNIRLGVPAPPTARCAAPPSRPVRWSSSTHCRTACRPGSATTAPGLSAGQRQRVALARVFLRDAPLVLLDEPTANLDAETEAGILAAIRAHATGRTVIMAATGPPSSPSPTASSRSAPRRCRHDARPAPCCGWAGPPPGSSPSPSSPVSVV